MRISQKVDEARTEIKRLQEIIAVLPGLFVKWQDCRNKNGDYPLYSRADSSFGITIRKSNHTDKFEEFRFVLGFSVVKVWNHDLIPFEFNEGRVCFSSDKAEALLMDYKTAMADYEKNLASLQDAWHSYAVLEERLKEHNRAFPVLSVRFSEPYYCDLPIEEKK